MKSRAAGFTLIEVLLSTVLLAAGLGLAFTTLRAATATAQRGEAMAERSERMRAVAGFLRRRISAALPIGFAMDDINGLPQRFVGEPDRIRFVADLPDYLGRGGPHLHDITLDADGDAQRLRVAFAVVQGGQTMLESSPREPELLAEGLRDVEFRYRALDADGAIGPWQDSWTTADRLPLQVSIRIVESGDRGDRGGGRPWPELVIALPLGGTVSNEPSQGLAR